MLFAVLALITFQPLCGSPGLSLFSLDLDLVSFNSDHSVGHLTVNSIGIYQITNANKHFFICSLVHLGEL